MEVAIFLVYMLFLRIPWTYLDIYIWYVVRKVFSKGTQCSWNHGKWFIGGEVIWRTSSTNRTQGGMRSGVLNRPSGGPGSDVWVLLTLPGTLEKGRPSFILEFITKVQGNLGHDKAPFYSIYNSPSTIRNSAKLDINGKLRPRRIQRRRLQGVWKRTHWGRWVLPKNQSFGLDKDY